MEYLKNPIVVGYRCQYTVAILHNTAPFSINLNLLMQMALYIEGGKIGFYSGDIKKLNEDMKALKPTCAVVVPRLLNRIYDSVTGKVKGSWLKESILNVGVWFKERHLHRLV
jgi:long-chain acyl-CoA synthetase